MEMAVEHNLLAEESSYHLGTLSWSLEERTQTLCQDSSLGKRTCKYQEGSPQEPQEARAAVKASV
jgi:hypothetical protein